MYYGDVISVLSVRVKCCSGSVVSLQELSKRNAVVFSLQELSKRNAVVSYKSVFCITVHSVSCKTVPVLKICVRFLSEDQHGTQ